MTPIEWLERAIIKPEPFSVIRRKMLELIDDIERPTGWESSGMHGQFNEGNADDTFRL